MAIVGNDRSSAVLGATGFSQCHRHHIPARVEVADDKTGLRLGQFLPDPGPDGIAVIPIGALGP